MAEGGHFPTTFRSLSTNPKVKELWKSVHKCQNYRKNKSGTLLYGPWWILQVSAEKMTHPYSTRILRVLPLDQIADVGAFGSEDLS